MEYKIKLTDEFLEEMEEISDYISNNLKAINVIATKNFNYKIKPMQQTYRL